MSDFRLGISFGHGGESHHGLCTGRLRDWLGDCPACGTRKGLQFGLPTEADYVRELGEKLVHLLPREVDVVPLNAHHENVSPSTRADRARVMECDFVLPLHVNSSDSPDTHGGHMLYLSEYPGVQAVARAIAEAWPTPLRRQLLPSTDRFGYVAGMVEPACTPYWPRAHALLQAYAPMPTVLVEAFYATNETDVQAGMDRWVQMEMLHAMARGVAVAARTFASSVARV